MDRNSNTYYYHYDGLGSVTEITDASGSIQESYKYSPYGNPSIFDSSGSPITSSAIGNPYMFTGRRWDDETAIYYYRERMYDPVIGRFLQRRDPLGYWDSMCLYTYVLNSPVNWGDPWGESWSIKINPPPAIWYPMRRGPHIFKTHTIISGLLAFPLRKSTIGLPRLPKTSPFTNPLRAGGMVEYPTPPLLPKWLRPLGKSLFGTNKWFGLFGRANSILFGIFLFNDIFWYLHNLDKGTGSSCTIPDRDFSGPTVL